jgi:hypothetical protein
MMERERSKIGRRRGRGWRSEWRGGVGVLFARMRMAWWIVRRRRGRGGWLGRCKSEVVGKWVVGCVEFEEYGEDFSRRM